MASKTSLESKYTVNPQTECWEWNRPLSNGYGLVRVEGKKQRGAHVVVYERHCGPVPNGMELDHLCRNPRCVNPNHLQPVSATENVRRGEATKLNPTVVVAIRNAYASGLLLESISKITGLCVGHLSEIVRGKYWKDAGGPISGGGHGRPKPGKRKLTDSQRAEIRKRRKNGEKRKILATIFGVAKETITKVCSDI